MNSRTMSRRLILIPIRFRPRKKLLLSLLLTVALPGAWTPLWAREKGFAYVAIGSPFAAGDIPMSVTVSSDNQFVYTANLASNNVSAYAIDARTGALTPLAGSPFAAGSNPASVVTITQSERRCKDESWGRHRETPQDDGPQEEFIFKKTPPCHRYHEGE
jgi:Lactonase, 7-bladed beta-propeller